MAAWLGLNYDNLIEREESIYWKFILFLRKSIEWPKLTQNSCLMLKGPMASVV